MRLFIGVELSEPVKKAVERASLALRAALERGVPGVQARWVPIENVHITLWFIGEVPDAEAGLLQRALTAGAMRTPAFDLALAGAGAFPSSGPPRVFWVGIAAGAAGMAALHRELAGRLEPLGIEPERRGYTAHATIARVKDSPRGAALGIRQILASLPADCGTMPVTQVTLFRSRLSPRGAAYDPWLRVPLS